MLMTQFKDLNEFLAKHSAKSDKNTPITHTRIGKKELNIYGGSYVIPKEELHTFYKLYYDHIFVNGKKEYLTEKQLEDDGPMAVDFDFRYSHDVDTRKHTKEHIEDMIVLYLEELKKYFKFEENNPFNILIFEKPNINRLEDGSLTKDGIHVLFCLKVNRVFQTMIRETMIAKLSEAWDLPLINTWDSVLDEGISRGTTNWQLYGSRKPGYEAYEMTQYFTITYDANDGEFQMDEKRVNDFDIKNNFAKLSVQYEDNPKFEINPHMLDEFNRRSGAKIAKPKRPASKTKVNLLVENDSDDESDEHISINNIKDKETLEKAMNIILKSFKSTDYELRETHEYTQALPEKYYEPGSHSLNRQVAFALKHTDERLFLSWVMLRSKASDFDFDTIPSLHAEWKKFHKTNKSNESVTRRSIMYWVKQDNFEEYEKIKKNTLNYLIEETLHSQTEYDLALVLKQMYKDRYICASYEKKGIWYRFSNNRWIQDKGISLREKISTEMYNLYSQKSDDYGIEYQHYQPNDDRAEFIKKQVKLIGEIKIKLKRTSDKNNIMREAAEIFYDDNFTKNMDTKKHLLCFNNGVVDFKNKVFRDGYPDDYITKTTRINYIPYEENKNNNKFKQTEQIIIDFMKQLFPVDDLNKYMWDHLSSCLIGTNKNQTFNVYHGSGSNGKSIIADLMSLTLGDLKGTVPITLVTEKRGLIGGTSDEVIKLKGVRYAVMQEPSKNVKLNEGIMKELTGGDPIQARGLYCESEIFEPQFNLVVCTNNLFDIESNDDGTWRRIRKCDFLAKFIDENDKNEYDTPYIYKKDKELKDKLPEYAEIFASMLVKRAFETGGIVEDCKTVLESSGKYRKGQDVIAAYIADRITKSDNPKDKIGKSSLNADFKNWFQLEQGNVKIPKTQELHDCMDKKFGSCTVKGWINVKFVQNEEEDEINEI